jgi:hypothetical protein
MLLTFHAYRRAIVVSSDSATATTLSAIASDRAAAMASEGAAPSMRDDDGGRFTSRTRSRGGDAIRAAGGSVEGARRMSRRVPTGVNIGGAAGDGMRPSSEKTSVEWLSGLDAARSPFDADRPSCGSTPMV